MSDLPTERRRKLIHDFTATVTYPFLSEWRNDLTVPASLYPYADQWALAAVHEYNPAPPPTARSKPDNSGAIGCIVLGVLVITGSVACAFFLPLALIGLVGGFVFLFLGISLYTTKAKADELAQARRESDVKRWQVAREQTIERTADELKRTVHTTIGLGLPVPQRLVSEFGEASRRHEHDRYSDWVSEIRWWQEQPVFPAAPEVPLERIDHEQYEYYCRDLLRSVGYEEAAVTRYSRDGGVDVESEELVVQCKHYTGSVGVREVREVFGIAQHRGKAAVLITSGSFTGDAMAFANDAGIALIHYDEMDGRPRLLNPAARGIWARHTAVRPPSV